MSPLPWRGGRGAEELSRRVAVREEPSHVSLSRTHIHRPEWPERGHQRFPGCRRVSPALKLKSSSSTHRLQMRRCKNKDYWLLSLGDILVSMRSCWLQDPKNACLCPLKTTCLLRNCKKKGKKILDPKLSEIASFGENLGKLGIVELILEAVDELVYSWRMETLVIVESVNPIFYSNLSLWEVVVGGLQFCVVTQIYQSSHL